MKKKEQQKIKIGKVNFINSEEKFDMLLSKIHKLDSKEGTDELTAEFLNMYNVKNRKQLVKSMLRSSKTNYAILKYFTRFIANISQITKEASTECVSALMEDYNDLNRQDKLNMFEERIKNIRFISEMVKFELFPMQNIFDILKRLIDDFKDYSIDVLCNLMESCGRFLYLNELSHLKFKGCLDTMKQLAHHRLSHDERAFNSVVNSIQICRPQESTLRKAVKVRSVEEEYIRFLLYQLLNKDSIKKVAALIRRMDWSTMEHMIFKVFYKFLNRANEMQIKNACSVLSILKEYHPSMIHNLVNIVLEEARIGLDKNDFNDNQHRILMCMLISQFYIYKLISSELVFYVSYMILTYNPEWNYYRRELIADNPLDSPYDTFRIQMVVTILDICGQYFKKEKLDEFIHFLQIYILSKQYLPLDVENKVTNCMENLYPNFHIYNDFAEALKDSKKFKGFNFDIDDIDSIHDEKNQYKVDENEYKRS
jgi:regulator of nonsense transcripts 2